MPIAANQRKRRTRSGFDPAVALQQKERGLSNQEIAKSHGVDQSTVWRFLHRTKPEIQALAEFQARRSDLLDLLQGKCLDLQAKILDSINEEGIIASLKQSEKTGLLMALNATHGTSYDKSRLERGLSTENHSIVSKLLDARVQARYKPGKVPNKATAEPTSSDPTDPHVEPHAEDDDPLPAGEDGPELDPLK